MSFEEETWQVKRPRDVRYSLKTGYANWWCCMSAEVFQYFLLWRAQLWKVPDDGSARNRVQRLDPSASGLPTPGSYQLQRMPAVGWLVDLYRNLLFNLDHYVGLAGAIAQKCLRSTGISDRLERLKQKEAVFRRVRSSNRSANGWSAHLGPVSE